MHTFQKRLWCQQTKQLQMISRRTESQHWAMVWGGTDSWELLSHSLSNLWRGAKELLQAEITLDFFKQMVKFYFIYYINTYWTSIRTTFPSVSINLVRLMGIWDWRKEILLVTWRHSLEPRIQSIKWFQAQQGFWWLLRPLVQRMLRSSGQPVVRIMSNKWQSSIRIQFRLLSPTEC